MSVAIIGGLDRLKRTYEKECRNRGFDARVLANAFPTWLDEWMVSIESLFLLGR